MENLTETIEQYQIRAVFDQDTIRVYQAYSEQIANSALKHGRFVAPAFKMGRMTWIKPSFLWMMYRAGWGFKDEGQARILAIDISRESFEWALANSCSSHADPALSKEEWLALKARTPVRVQWDPERDFHFQALPHRAIQIGLGPQAVPLYVEQWIQKISDVTPLAHAMHALVKAGELAQARQMMPIELPYPAQTLPK